jgi:hypothetical protein
VPTAEQDTHVEYLATALLAAALACIIASFVLVRLRGANGANIFFGAAGFATLLGRVSLTAGTATLFVAMTPDRWSVGFPSSSNELPAWIVGWVPPVLLFGLAAWQVVMVFFYVAVDAFGAHRANEPNA